MVQLNPNKWGKKKEEEKPKRRGRPSLKERQKHQKKIQEKRDADWKKHLESVAERNKNNPRAKASRNRTAQREAVKANKEALKTPKPKSSTKSRALMTKPERAAADRAARLARSKARKAKK